MNTSYVCGFVCLVVWIEIALLIHRLEHIKFIDENSIIYIYMCNFSQNFHLCIYFCHSPVIVAPKHVVTSGLDIYACKYTYSYFSCFQETSDYKLILRIAIQNVALVLGREAKEVEKQCFK